MTDKRLILPALWAIIFLTLAAGSVSALELDAKAAVLMDARSGQILFAHNSETPLPVASLTKMMTLTIVLEALDRGEIALTDVITASEFAASKRGSRIWLEAGEQMTLEELLYAIAVGSANDAAVAVAEYIAGSEDEFVALMNQRAQELGLSNTHYKNASGLPPESGSEHTMTALDVAHLARHVLSVPKMMDYVSVYEYTMRANTTKIPVLWNSNRLLRRYQGVDGIKTGFTTAAGYCIAATAVRDDLRLLAVVLGSPSDASRETDTKNLLDYGFRRYHNYLAGTSGNIYGQVHIWNGNPKTADAVLADDLFVTVERGREGELTYETTLYQDLRAPLDKDSTVGTIEVLLDGQVLATAALVASTEIERASFFGLVSRTIKAMAEAVF